ncbi:helix-turn-helix domain-containing protein [Porphyrobacter sp. AAP60]|uniref:helix-turn-helix domain-containing protein n=1 Tax=Porphyrobacter sp. AAP60 TaxID=1523423 RepID=UPI0009E88FD6|nr:AraC family transcriptional regulator [Porphyrobacter sp. AAP60]
MLTATPASALRRIPQEMQDAVLHRGQWSLCAMEHSLIGAVHLTDPGAPFHHFGLCMGSAPVRAGMSGDGRPLGAALARGDMAVIEAGVGGTSWWDTPFESACFYFTDESLALALGRDVDPGGHLVRSAMGFRSSNIRRLLETLQADAAAGQPHGALVGDAVFVALASALVVPEHDWACRAQPGTPDWRVRRALEYIHAHLTEPMTIPEIAAAAGTSPFHLNRQFRVVMGTSLWRYILHERARVAFDLMQDSGLSLTVVSAAAGFETYTSFIDATRSRFGLLPSKLRRTLGL